MSIDFWSWNNLIANFFLTLYKIRSHVQVFEKSLVIKIARTRESVFSAKCIFYMWASFSHSQFRPRFLLSKNSFLFTGLGPRAGARYNFYNYVITSSDLTSAWIDAEVDGTLTDYRQPVVARPETETWPKGRRRVVRLSRTDPYIRKAPSLLGELRRKLC